ncbi:MAG: ferredoxin--NADP reductase [Chloroflexi bacterium]|nr:ferredoxin--NADP reductase [Chloroflexota bacterium]
MAGEATLDNVGTPRVRVAPKLAKAKLVERRDITPDLWIIKLEPEEGPLRFKAGQYCTLGLKGIERAYSIVSAPHEPYLEIFVELVPDGELTPLMWEMKVGETMSIRPRAKGLFLMNQRVHHHFMASTVTGVAPSMSIIRSYLHQGGEGHKFYILLGASYQDELTYDKELAGLAAKYPDCIHFVPTVSRPDEARNAGWQGEKGRVNTIVAQYLERFNLPKNDTMIYACGHPGMIADVKELALAQEWNFAEERFWKE